MEEPQIYEIRVAGLISESWSDWFDGLQMRHEAGGVTVLAGRVSDQEALYGILGKLHALNLPLIAVRQVPGFCSLPGDDVKFLEE